LRRISEDGHGGENISRVIREFRTGGPPLDIISGVVVTGSPIAYLPETAGPASPLLVDHW
jgi:hypothetical protein